MKEEIRNAFITHDGGTAVEYWIKKRGISSSRIVGLRWGILKWYQWD